MFFLNSGLSWAKNPEDPAQAEKIAFMKSGERPIIPQLAHAHLVIISLLRTRSSIVLGMRNDSPTGSPVVGEANVISSRSAGSCCMS